MASVRYSEIRNGTDSSSIDNLSKEVSEIYKSFGGALFIAGGAALAITRMSSMHTLLHPGITLLALLAVFVTGYFGYRVIQDSLLTLGKFYLAFHSISWGILLGPLCLIHPELDGGSALLAGGVLFFCMSFMGQIESHEVIGKISLLLFLSIGAISSFLVSILVLHQGVLSFAFSTIFVALTSLMVWTESRSLKVVILDISDDKLREKKCGMLGAMHLIGAAPGYVFSALRFSKVYR